MTVSELINLLRKCPPDAPAVDPSGSDIDDVGTAQAVRLQDEYGGWMVGVEPVDYEEEQLVTVVVIYCG